jgi:hypothetical protein
MNEKRYPWPASAVSEKEMQMLYNMRQKSKIPITKLVKEAIRKTYCIKEEQ